MTGKDGRLYNEFYDDNHDGMLDYTERSYWDETEDDELYYGNISLPRRTQGIKPSTILKIIAWFLFVVIYTLMSN